MMSRSQIPNPDSVSFDCLITIGKYHVLKIFSTICSLPLDWSDTFLSGFMEPAEGWYPSRLSLRLMLDLAIFFFFLRHFTFSEILDKRRHDFSKMHQTQEALIFDLIRLLNKAG